jgi:uncharacterized membrane protein
MKRVCDSGSHGQVAIVDITIESNKVDEFNQMERNLTFTKLKSMMQKVGLTNLKSGHYKVSHQLDEHLQASFPNNREDLDKIRKIFAKDIGKNRLGLEIQP